MPDLKILEKTINNVVVLTLKGRLDITTRNILTNKINSLYDNKKSNIILDCEELKFIDSNGIGEILQDHRKLVSIGGKLKITSLHTQPESVFKLMQLHNAWEIFDNLETAIKSFK